MIIRQLAGYLSQFGFFQPLATTYYTDSGLPVKKITLSSLTVHLTDQEQPHGKVLSYTEEGQEYVYQTFGFDYRPVQSLKETYDLHLYVQVHKDIIKKEAADELEDRFLYQILVAVWDLTHPLLATHENSEERLVGLDEFIDREANKEFFAIKKL